MEKTDVLVSVYCAAYNHDIYISDALNGFVNQETNFKYEVIVHDDASTDGTAKIVREYAARYPDIIKPVFQSENQYSKNVKIFDTFILPKMQGKYIAYCEGDDYWTDTLKLQKQVDFLELNPEYVACVHNSNVLNCVTGELRLRNNSKIEQDIDFVYLIRNWGQIYQTSSLVYRRSYAESLLSNRPDYFEVQCGFGDYLLATYLSLEGKIKYLPQIMSTYRLFANGSWTSKNAVLKPDVVVKRTENTCKILRLINEYTEGRYESDIKDVILGYEFRALWIQKKYADCRSEKYRRIWKTKSLKWKIKFYLNVLVQPFSRGQEKG